jgi:hypothetical protein
MEACWRCRAEDAVGKGVYGCYCETCAEEITPWEDAAIRGGSLMEDVEQVDKTVQQEMAVRVAEKIVELEELPDPSTNAELHRRLERIEILKEQLERMTGSDNTCSGTMHGEHKFGRDYHCEYCGIDKITASLNRTRCVVLPPFESDNPPITKSPSFSYVSQPTVPLLTDNRADPEKAQKAVTELLANRNLENSSISINNRREAFKKKQESRRRKKCRQ